MTTQVNYNKTLDVDQVLFSSLDLSIQRSAIDVTPKKLASLHLCTGLP